jgi:hypothetical protein
LTVVSRGLGSGELEDHGVRVVDRLGGSYQRELCRPSLESVELMKNGKTGRTVGIATANDLDFHAVSSKLVESGTSTTHDPRHYTVSSVLPLTQHPMMVLTETPRNRQPSNVRRTLGEVQLPLNLLRRPVRVLLTCTLDDPRDLTPVVLLCPVVQSYDLEDDLGIDGGFACLVVDPGGGSGGTGERGRLLQLESGSRGLDSVVRYSGAVGEGTEESASLCDLRVVLSEHLHG